MHFNKCNALKKFCKRKWSAYIIWFLLLGAAIGAHTPLAASISLEYDNDTGQWMEIPGSFLRGVDIYCHAAISYANIFIGLVLFLLSTVGVYQCRACELSNVLPDNNISSPSSQTLSRILKNIKSFVFCYCFKPYYFCYLTYFWLF